VCTAFIGKALEFGLTKGRYKVGERYPGEARTTPSVVLARSTAANQSADLRSNESNLNGHSYKKGSEGANGDTSPIADRRSALVQNLNDLADIFFNIRGIGWDFGTEYPLHIPHEWRQTEPVGVFLRQTAVQLCLSLLVFDLLECGFKLIPGVGTPEGGSIFLLELPPLQRYSLSTMISLMTGLVVIFAFQMWYNYFTLIGVGLLGHSPLSWPPLFNAPLKAQSVSSFWGARWHQLVRQSFFVYGGYPLQWLCATAASLCRGKDSKAARKAGEIGLVVGTFIGSGLFHGLGIWTMHAGSGQKEGFDYQAPIYFTACSFAVLAERLFKMTTGKKVRGIWGWLWTAFWILIASQMMG
jgi:Membrane bound O-acyl transferase family